MPERTLASPATPLQGTRPLGSTAKGGPILLAGHPQLAWPALFVIVRCDAGDVLGSQPHSSSGTRRATRCCQTRSEPSMTDGSGAADIVTASSSATAPESAAGRVLVSGSYGGEY